MNNNGIIAAWGGNKKEGIGRNEDIDVEMGEIKDNHVQLIRPVQVGMTVIQYVPESLIN